MASTILGRTLAANAVFSAVTGIVLVGGAAPLSRWLEIPTWVTAVVGLGLLPFASAVAWVARNPRRHAVGAVILADITWVITATVVLIMFPGSMSTAGLRALAVVTVAVAGFAVLQVIGLGRTRQRSTTMTLESSRIIDAPPRVVWEIIADLDAYQEHSDTLIETTVISGDGQGATRRCVDAAGNDWEETCTTWEPERRYVIEVDVSTYPARYRAAFRTFTGTWSLEPVDGGSLVTIRFHAELRPVPGLTMLAAKMAKRGRTDMEAILGSYARTAALNVDRTGGNRQGERE